MDTLADSYCHGYHDNMTCWPPTEVGAIATVKCREVTSLPPSAMPFPTGKLKIKMSTVINSEHALKRLFRNSS